jgi:glycosyltransferase involved in cell wall biosynthesis
MTAIERPKCSVVIPTMGRNADLERCLEAVAAQTHPSFDVIVVDNSSGDPATREIAEKAGARYVHENRRGLCRARNRGALVSSAVVVAYLDDDSVPEPSWLEALDHAFDNPAVMGASGKTVPLKIEAESERMFSLIRGEAYNRPTHIIVDRSNAQWFEISGFGGIGPGCNMAVRRSAFEVWPGFHERTDRGTPVHGGGEQYAFFSLVARGFAVAYCPDAVVRHPFPPTMEALRRRHFQDIVASTAYFTMLLIEEPAHRRATLRYLWEAMTGATREWRNTPSQRPRVISRTRTALALGLGPLRYLQGLLYSGR